MNLLNDTLKNIRAANKEFSVAAQKRLDNLTKIGRASCRERV
jgi:hypothetical protein